MHELSLFAQVPPSGHDQLLKVLAGVSGMQPQAVLERHLVFKPIRPPGKRTVQVGGSQGVQNAHVQAIQGQLGGELYYMQLVKSVGETSHMLNINHKLGLMVGEESATEAHRQLDGPPASNGANGDLRLSKDKESQEYSSANDRLWRLVFSDLPEVGGRRPVTSRMVSNVDIMDGDPLEFMHALGYTFVSEYYLQGYRFVYHNVIILVHQVLRLPPGTEPRDTPAHEPQPPTDLRPLDPSGAYMLHSSIRVQDGNKPESMALAITELKAFKDLMRGAVDLDVGDRLSLDTRVR
ncbi:putative RNA polymerase II mediator complex subunit Srb5 [Xylona heveae TC161]|uniref:Mediator of RNA polymerase II transcription subunit 18 n=1 Tax=Xylona heveae (strain CBS 132557 / TC161) TaxID=1328760 RepID=A0A161THN3_XYLHT|nr:putative RNA polymerase II mediator complex subunit Srb5 [Xylona heveae TC161]KZF25767.1 putative RNA polymerase II mediator complex subunit Srb5 [Xylona heveae TC161]